MILNFYSLRCSVSLTLSLSLSLYPSLSLSLSRSLSLCLSLSLYHPLSNSLSLSFSPYFSLFSSLSFSPIPSLSFPLSLSLTPTHPISLSRSFSLCLTFSLYSDRRDERPRGRVGGRRTDYGVIVTHLPKSCSWQVKPSACAGAFIPEFMSAYICLKHLSIYVTISRNSSLIKQ